MLKKNLVLGMMLIMLLAMSTSLMAQPAPNAPASGEGIPADPYQIETINNIVWITASDAVVPNPTQATRWSANYIQMVNIDASLTPNWDGGAGFSPIGNSTTKFTGSYDGQNHTIDGLFINRSGTNYNGFFGYTYGATVQNLGLTNVNISGHEYTGGLVGCTYSSCTVSDCYTTGSVTGNNNDTGGLVGQNNGSAISNSYSTATVIGVINTGGLVGRNQNGGTISACYSTGSVTVIYNNHAGDAVGGLIGCHQNEGTISTVSNCYSRGDVTRSAGGNTKYGSFIGANGYATVENCYSTGSVYYTCCVGDDPTDKGFIGSSYAGTLTANFFDSEASNQATGTGATAKTTTLMKTQSTFTDAGWDFVGETTNGTEDIWEIIGTNYPRLKDNPDPTLPVILSTFTAQFLENTPTLYWETQSETDNMGWFVYRNIEEDFTTSEKISEFIEGQGTTSQQQSYLYEDRIQNPEVGDTYYYWLESIDYSGTVHHYDRVALIHIPGGQDPDPHVAVPMKYGLQPGPNPFNSNLNVSYMLPQTDMVRIEIYNMHGQLIAQFNEGLKTADKKYTLEWDGKDLYGQNVSSGVLLIKIITSEGSETKKAILLR